MSLPEFDIIYCVIDYTYNIYTQQKWQTHQTRKKIYYVFCRDRP